MDGAVCEDEACKIILKKHRDCEAAIESEVKLIKTAVSPTLKIAVVHCVTVLFMGCPKAVVRLLRGMTENATSLYGIFSGCAITIINLPVSVCYGLAASSIPQISPLAEKGDIG